MNNIAQRLVHLIKVALDNEATDIHIIKTGEEVTIEERVNKKLVTIKKELDDEKLIGFIAHEAGLVTTLPEAQTGSFTLKVNDINVKLKASMLAYNEDTINMVVRIYPQEEDNVSIPEIDRFVEYANTLDKDKKFQLIDLLTDILKVNVEDLLVYAIAQDQMVTYLSEAGVDTTLSMEVLEKLKQISTSGNYTEIACDNIWEELSYEVKPLAEETIKQYKTGE